MQDVGFKEVDAYVLRRQNTVMQYIVNRPILGFCKETVQRTGARVIKRWWVQ